MAITPYSPTYWSDDEPIYTRKLNQMSSNDQYLFEHLPGTRYQGYGLTRDEGVKIASGTLLFTPFTTMSERTQSFGAFFSSACKPIITTGVVANYGHLFPIVRGLDDTIPDHRGFICRVNTLIGGTMTQNFYVTWHAIGF